MEDLIFQKEFGVKAQGRYKARVLDESKNLISETKWKPNLILDSGLDLIANVPWASAFQWCVSGTSDIPTKRISNSTTWYENNVTRTVGSTFAFSLDDVGRILYIPSIDKQLRIVSYTNEDTVVVNESRIPMLSNVEMRVYHVEQTELICPHSMNMQYETSEGMCGTVISGSSIKLSRTFNFYMEKTPVLIKELGFLPCPTETKLFSRVVLDAPLYLSSGQFLQVSYELSVTLNPNTPVTRSVNVTGWPISPSTNTSGSEQIQRYGMAIVGGDGVAVPYDLSYLCNEPYAPGSYFLGPEYGYVNRWKNSTTSSPTKIYDPNTSTPFVQRNSGTTWDGRNRNYKLNYMYSFGQNYAWTTLFLGNNSYRYTPWSNQSNAISGSNVNQAATISDLMKPVLLPPLESPDGDDWNGIDPYTKFPNVVPYTGTADWSNWTDSGSIGGSGSGSVSGASVFISTVSESHASVGSSVDRSATCVEVPLVIEPYVTGSFELVKKGTFFTNIANRTDWRCIGIGPTSKETGPANRKDAAKYNGYCFIFDQPQTKLNTHNLNIFFKYSWNRDLSEA